MANLYTAFLSSNFSSLKDLRGRITSSFLDCNIFPIAMEHFVVDANNGFDNIKKLIDDADMFVLIMGATYGSRDENDIRRASWTEKEYRYVAEKAKANVLIIVLKELADFVKSVDENLGGEISDEETIAFCPTQSPEDTRSQVAFAREVMGASFAKVASVDAVCDCIHQFIQNKLAHNELVGWSRNVSNEEIEKSITLGRYYHCHLSSMQSDYLRVGYLEIKRGDGGYGLDFDGKNYQARITQDEDGNYKVVPNKMKYTSWTGRYTLDVAHHSIEGIYKARKVDVEQNGDKVIRPGIRDGIHTFEIDGEDDDYGIVLTGKSQDAITEGKDGKECNIWIFGSKEGRDRYVIDNFLSEE